MMITLEGIILFSVPLIAILLWWGLGELFSRIADRKHEIAHRENNKQTKSTKKAKIIRTLHNRMTEVNQEEDGSEDNKPYRKSNTYINKRIEEEINEVIRLIGVSEPVDAVSMFNKILDGKEIEVIQEIAKLLSLPMKVNLIKAKEAPKINPKKERIAEVRVGDIPLFGSSRLDYWPCTITVYPGYNTNPNRFITVISHELCHFVLQSLRGRISDSEKEERMTDIASIFSGFKTAIQASRKSDISGTTGYLNDIEADYTFNRYDELLSNKREQRTKLTEFLDNVLERNADALLFVRYCKKLLDNPNTNITNDDKDDISVCLSTISPKEIKEIISLYRELKHSLSSRRYTDFDTYEDKIKKIDSVLSGVCLPASGEISTLIKYVGSDLSEIKN